MGATADQIAQLRRMVAEPTEATYTDVILTGIIESYPVIDMNGQAPMIPAIDSVHPVTWVPYMDVTDLVENIDWKESYDLNMAASQIWEEKAANPAADYDFSADGGNFSRSQVYEQAMKQARHYAARRKAGTIKLVPQPNRRLTGNIQ